MKKANGMHDRVMTREQLAQQADRLALKAGACSRDDAFRQIDQGKLAGTIVEAELKMLRSMIKSG